MTDKLEELDALVNWLLAEAMRQEVEVAYIREPENRDGWFDTVSDADLENMALRAARHRQAAALLRAQAEEIAMLREAVSKSLPYLQDLAETPGYGYARPENPHDFSPDAECCTEEEIAAHKAACEAFDRGEYDPSADPSSLSGPGVHLLRAPWGIGSYTFRDPHVMAIIDTFRTLGSPPDA